MIVRLHGSVLPKVLQRVVANLLELGVMPDLSVPGFHHVGFNEFVENDGAILLEKGLSFLWVRIEDGTMV